MTLTLTSALSLFVLIALSTAVFFAAKRFKIPYTVFLVLVGLLLVPIVNLPYLNHVFGFLDDMVLTPELLFYIFLPALIFESGFNMSMRKMLDSSYAISLMAVVSLFISASVIGGLLYLLLPLIGFHLPLIVALMFGAIISPTDPVAVLSIFKEAGAPKRLAMIFEGETLLNDGTAMALFFVFLSVAINGFNGAETVIFGIIDFTLMIVLGVVVGLAMAALFSKALRFTKKNEFVTVTLMMISAHMIFIVAELINHSGVVHISPIVATAVGALFLGNYSRCVLAPKVEEYTHKLIEHMSFVVNSLVFLMAGLLFASSGINFAELWLPIVITVLVVAFARAVSVYAVTIPLNKAKLEQEIPASWEKLLSWGSLRGSLSIIIVMLIPEDFTVEGWEYPYTPHDFLLALTIGCILATLFIKAPLIKPFMRKFNITNEDILKDAHTADLAVYYLLTEKDRLHSYKDKGFVTSQQYDHLCKMVDQKLNAAELKRADMIDKHGADLFDQSLHLAMVHVEKATLKRMFINDEVSEKTYRKLHSKLCLQQDKIEAAQHNDIDPKVFTDRKDIFDRMMSFLQAPFDRNRNVAGVEQRMEYYRAQMIMARKAVRTIKSMQNEFECRLVFLPQSYERVLNRYETYMRNSGIKLQMLVEQNKESLAPYLSKLAERTLGEASARAMTYLRDSGLTDESLEHAVLEQYCPDINASHDAH
jgi:CPA1 family monovalent cation:H+ antiporter